MNVANETMERHRLECLVRESPLAVGLVDLTRLRLVAGSPSAGVILGWCDLDDIDVLSLVSADEVTRSVIELMRAGAIDAYEARRLFVRADGGEQLIHLWARGLAAHGFGDFALVVFGAIEDVDVTSMVVRNPVAVQRSSAVAVSDEDGVVDHCAGRSSCPRRVRGSEESGVDALVGEIRALDLVDAMTYLPAAAELPGLVEDLTEREWEIVARLLRGDRAPASARVLYLAPSTVRNHLTAVFRKLGVHSQQEVISRFRSQHDSRGGPPILHDPAGADVGA